MTTRSIGRLDLYGFAWHPRHDVSFGFEIGISRERVNIDLTLGVVNGVLKWWWRQ